MIFVAIDEDNIFPLTPDRIAAVLLLQNVIDKHLLVHLLHLASAVQVQALGRVTIL